MTKQFGYHELVQLPLTVIVLVRRATADRPLFRSEFVIEDLILLLALASYVVPFRFKRLIGLLIACLLSTAMALIRTPASSKVSLAFFALLGLHSATLALIELFRLRRRGLDVILPPD